MVREEAFGEDNRNVPAIVATTLICYFAAIQLLGCIVKCCKREMSVWDGYSSALSNRIPAVAGREVFFDAVSMEEFDDGVQVLPGKTHIAIGRNTQTPVAFTRLNR